LDDAEYSLGEAKTAYERGIYHRAVRRSQECVELSLKAILRLVGVEYPRQHEVSAVLEDVVVRKRLPGWFISSLPQISLISKRLAEERGPAFYGEERALTPPRSLYGESDAKRALKDAREIFSLCKRALREWKVS
ncbi:MAG: HEPN domain-containing protein, partial [Candidatus Bathyarchaeia archaeon]